MDLFIIFIDLNLYHLNVFLIEVVHLWKEFGHALGLKPFTLKIIKSQYLHHHNIEYCLTEVLAAWLSGKDRPHDSPGPNWGEVKAALETVEMKRLAHQLTRKLTGMYYNYATHN